VYNPELLERPAPRTAPKNHSETTEFQALHTPMTKVISSIIIALSLLCPLVSTSAQQSVKEKKGTVVSTSTAKASDDDAKTQSAGIAATLPPPVSAEGARLSTPTNQGLSNSETSKEAANKPRPDGRADSPAIESTSKVAVSDQRPLTDIYRVGVGDVLDIHLFKSATSRSTLFTVIGGGYIDLPVAGGPVSVSGLTPEEIQTRIAAELKRRAVEDGAQVVVGIRQYVSHTVVITGLVNTPGTKILRREAVPLYVILAETQLRSDAGRVVIMRAGTPGQVLDSSDPSTLNTNVIAGDVISVSGRPQEFYYIGGRINYPGQKTFQPGITLLQAILAAGGLSRQSDSTVEVSREGAEGRLITTKFNIKEIKSGKMEDPKLQSGDRVEVLH
jgi:polysaccharide export outer membrane protein